MKNVYISKLSTFLHKIRKNFTEFVNHHKYKNTIGTIVCLKKVNSIYYYLFTYYSIKLMELKYQQLF